METRNNCCNTKVESSSSGCPFTEEPQLGEEEKMDKFYELIRRFSVARDYQRRILQSPHQKAPKGVDQDEDQDEDQDQDHQPGWVPSFKWEDFKNVEDVNFSKITSDDHDNYHRPNYHHHVEDSSPNRKSLPPHPTAPVVRCSNCVHVYFSDEHCHEKKKKRKTVDFVEHVERETQQLEPETNVTGLDLNLAL